MTPAPHCIFIASQGRTGTHTLGYLLSDLIEDSVSMHEPDVMPLSEMHLWPKKIREFGFAHLFLGKFSPHHSLRLLGLTRLRGLLNDEQVRSDFHAMRAPFIARQPASTYIEANLQLRYLIDLLPGSFPGAKAVYLIRDPLTWLASWQNKRAPINSRLDPASWGSRGRITTRDIDYVFDADAWPRLPLQTRLIWQWLVENRYILERHEQIGGFMLLRFEDLFDPNQTNGALALMLEYICSGGEACRYRVDTSILARKIDATSGRRAAPELLPETRDLLHRSQHILTRLGYTADF